jgi:hypothetical protein
MRKFSAILKRAIRYVVGRNKLASASTPVTGGPVQWSDAVNDKLKPEVLAYKLEFNTAHALGHWLSITKAYDALYRGFKDVGINPGPDEIIAGMLNVGHIVSPDEDDSLRDRHVVMYGNESVEI